MENFNKKWMKRFDKAAKKDVPNYKKSLWSNKKSHINRMNLFLKIFNKNVKNKPRILDIGCGPGEYCNLISNKCNKVIGIDFSNEIINIAKKNKKEKNIEYIKGTIKNLDFKDNSFDIASSIGLFQCIEKYKKAIKEMDRVTKKEGFLLICTLKKQKMISEIIPLFFYLLFKTKFNLVKIRDIIKNRYNLVSSGDKMIVRHNPKKFKMFLKKMGYKNIKIYYLDPTLKFISNEFMIIAKK